jgi:carbonic anhydrase
VLQRALEKGWIASTPTRDCRYDLVLDDREHLYRVQVKYAGRRASHCEGAVSLDFTKGGRRNRTYLEHEIDAVLAYVAPAASVTWLGPRLFHGRRNIQLRYAATRSGQKNGCLRIEDLRWSEVASVYLIESISKVDLATAHDWVRGRGLPMSVTDQLVRNAERYAASFSKGDLPMPPGKGVAVVACMDARVNPYGLLGLQEGDAHVIRNAGGVVSDDVIRSLAISQRLLGTREIILIHHTDCGMLTFTDDQVKAQIEADTGIRPPFALEAFADAEQDVKQSMARIAASPFVPHKDQVRGFVYDVRSGRLNEVGVTVAA